MPRHIGYITHQRRGVPDKWTIDPFSVWLAANAMSKNLHAAAGRQSWRRSTASEGTRRSAGRVLFSLLAIGLTVLLIWLLWPAPDRRTHLLLISQTEYDRGLVLPVLYGEAAVARLRELERDNPAISTERFDGRTRARLAQQLKSNFETTDDGEGSGARLLPDDHNCLITFVRGYLVEGDDGAPYLACSDFSPSRRPDVSPFPNGILPLADVLQPLTQAPGGRKLGPRLVVLDPEPLASDPRLMQSGESFFRLLHPLLKDLQGPAASQVWVLTTRGPLEVPGWDHQAQLPLTVELFARALSGQADLDQSGTVELDELVRFMRAQYAFSAGRHVDLAPQPVLLRGTQGLVEADRAPAGVFLAQVQPWRPAADKPAADKQQPAPDGAPPADRQPPAGKPQSGKDATAATAAGTAVRPVAWQGDASADPAASPAAPDPAAAPPTAAESATGGGTTGEGNAGAATAPGAAGDGAAAGQGGQPGAAAAAGQVTANPGAAAAAAASPPPGTAPPPAAGRPAVAATTPDFWMLRDRLEQMPTAPASEDSPLGVVGTAPQLWRDAISRALWAEWSGQPQDVQELILLAQASEQGVSLDRPGTTWDPLRQSWNRFVESRDHSQRVDQQVQAADALQQAIAVARARWWHWLCWSRQWIAWGNPPAQNLETLRDAIHEAEQVLLAAAGRENVNVSAMHERVRGLDMLVEALDQEAAETARELQQQLSGGDPQDRWLMARQAETFLRSSLLKAGQRDLLWQTLRSVPSPLGEWSLVEGALASAPQRGDPLRADPQKDRRAQQLLDGECDFLQSAEPSDMFTCNLRGIVQQYTQLATQDASVDWPRLMRMDSRDAAAVSQRDPVFAQHLVPPRPHVPQPHVEVPSQIQLQHLQKTEIVSVQIDPDRPQATRVTARLLSDGGPVRAQWQTAEDADRRVATITVPPGETATLRLQITATAFGSSSRPSSSVTVQLSCEDFPQLLQNMPERSIQVQLPREDLFRLVVQPVRNIGFSKPIRSGEGEMDDGVFLKPYCNRVSPFLIGLQNESGSDRVVRVRLLPLPNPFANAAQPIQAYWPDLLIHQREYLTHQLTDGQPHVVEAWAQRVMLAEAANLTLPDGQFVPIPWKRPGAAPPAAEAAEGAAEPAAKPAAAADSSAGVSVDHGMAVVVTELLEDGTPSANPDRLFWLFPRPRDPSTYVRIDAEQSQYQRDGFVRILPRSIEGGDVDGDQIRDTIPEIDERDVEIRWVEDDQWGPASTVGVGTVRDQRVGLRTPSYLEIPARADRDRTIARLEVDGWPRAIHWSVPHRPGATGEKVTVRDRLRWDQLVIVYDDPPPGVGPADLPPPSEPVRPDADQQPGQILRAYFRPGKHVLARLAADFSVGSFLTPGAEEVQIAIEGTDTPRRFWTDRIVTTRLENVLDTGELQLRTSVSDIETAWPEAQRPNRPINLDAQLLLEKVPRASDSAAIVIDDSRPQLQSITAIGASTIRNGDPVTFGIRADDDHSGIRRLLMGVDFDGDGEIDAKPAPKVLNFDPPARDVRDTLTVTGFETVKLEPGTYRVMAQAWDAVGLATAKASAPFIVRQRPQPPKPGDGPAAAVKRGTLQGTISGGFVSRGKVSIDPAAPGIEPGAELAVSGSDPSFAFRNVPEGSYTIRFTGLIGNQTEKTYAWTDMKPDVSGGRPRALRADASSVEKKP